RTTGTSAVLSRVMVRGSPVAGPPGAAARPRDPASGPAPGGSRGQGMAGGPSGLRTSPLVPVIKVPRPDDGGAAARSPARLGRGDRISSPQDGPRPGGTLG